MAEGTSGPRDVLKLAKDAGPQTVDLRFCDLPGLMQHFSIPVEEFTEEGFADGYGFDGSSIRGYQEIQESPGPRPGRGVHRLLPEGPHTGRALPRPRPDHRGDVLATPRGIAKKGRAAPHADRHRGHLMGTGVRVTHLRLDPVRPEPTRGLLPDRLGGGVAAAIGLVTAAVTAGTEPRLIDEQVDRSASFVTTAR
jgi:hypothetical protein